VTPPQIRIGVTLGDPSGIGPEIVARALAARPELAASVRAFGDAAQLADLPPVSETVVASRLRPEDRTAGRPSPAGGAAQVAYLEAAVAAARAGEIQALVTAPISKAQARAAGFGFPGHTEFLAERLGAPGRPLEHAMMFAGPTLRVALATIHIPLAEVARRLAPADIARAGALLAQALARDFGVPAPRIGVLGLNPHAGEGGMMMVAGADGMVGDEEERIVVPGIAAARARAPFASFQGPLVPDAAFRTATKRPPEHPPEHPPKHAYDGFVALYHDQGLIPVKLVDFERAVNVTLGLPIVRTSPDHGVAYDIAGTGTARHESFLAALDLGYALASRLSEKP
jgi:4-hydroxythreonine-4-phosphate dehydrogenase